MKYTVGIFGRLIAGIRLTVMVIGLVVACGFNLVEEVMDPMRRGIGEKEYESSGA